MDVGHWRIYNETPYEIFVDLRYLYLPNSYQFTRGMGGAVWF